MTSKIMGGHTKNPKCTNNNDSPDGGMREVQVGTLPKFLSAGAAAAMFGDGGAGGRIHITYCKGTLHKQNNTELVQSVCTKLKSNWVKIK